MNILTDILSLFKRKQFIESARDEDVLILGINEAPEIEGIASPVPYKNVKLIKVKDFINFSHCEHINVPIGSPYAGIFRDKTTDPITGECYINLRRLKSLSLNLIINESLDGDFIEFNCIAELNTASNVGGGSEVFLQKVGEDLEFRTLTSLDGSVTITQGADTIDLSVISVGAETLAETLALGNVTGVNDIIIDINQVIKSGSGGGQLNLRDGVDDAWSLTSDNGAYGVDSAWVYGLDGNSSQLALQISASEAIGVGIFASGTEPSQGTGKEVVIIDNTTVDATMNAFYLTRATFIASNLSTIKTGVTNTVILGGNGITGNTSNTAYVEQLGFWQVGTTEGLLKKANLTASRNWTLPDETGIVMVGPAFNALIATPTITEDGKVIAWNDAGQEYELIAVGVGTVTSIDATIGGTAITAGGVPITTSGTIAFTYNGAATDYIDGAGDFQPFPAIPVLPANIVETVTTTDGSFIDLTPNAPIDGAVTVTADLSATGTADATTFLRGDNTWATPAGPSLRNVSATDTFATANETINCTANTFTVNLPTAVGIQGTTYILVNSGTGVITLDPNGTETINGSLTINLTQYITRTVQSDGANWIII